MADVVTLRQINRSYLARQMLLERHDISTLAAVERLIALQAQDVMPPYLGLWSRLRNFDRNDLHNGLLDKILTRATLLRGTVHLTTRNDLLRILPMVMPELIKYAQAPATLGGLLTRINADELLTWGRTIFGERDLGAKEIRQHAQKDWPNLDHAQVTRAVQCMLPLMQVPPRGLWKTNARPRWALADAWLGASVDQTCTLEQLILRYIAAYGPIASGDFQAWSRLTGSKDAMNRLRPQLRKLEDETGRELLDFPDAPWPDAETPAPVRLLGAFDNLWLAHKNRDRVLDDRFRLKILNNGVGRPTLLVDGFVAGRYQIRTSKAVSTLLVEPFRKFSKSERREILSESGRLLDFVEPETDHEVTFVEESV